MSFHQRSAAEILGSITGGSFIASHWFLVADTLVHFMASAIAVITGIPAAIYYIRELIKWIREKVKK